MVKAPPKAINIYIPSRRFLNSSAQTPPNPWLSLSRTPLTYNTTGSKIAGSMAFSSAPIIYPITSAAK
jgi:hypothetical protein